MLLKGVFEGRSPSNPINFPSLIKGKFEGAKPLQQPPSPSPLKERGIKGVR